MKTGISRTLSVIAAALAGSIIAASPSLAAGTDREPFIHQELKIKPKRKLTQREAEVISSAATKALVHIADARGDIKIKDSDKAKRNLEQSEKLLEIIQAAMPTATVKDRIWIAGKHLEYKDTREVLPDLVPVYRELDFLEDFVPTEKTKEHIDKAKEHMQKGNKKAAIEQLKAADVAVVYGEVDLPLQETESRVKAALSALEKGDLAKADEALQAAEDSIDVVAVAVNAPLGKDVPKGAPKKAPSEMGHAG